MNLLHPCKKGGIAYEAKKDKEKSGTKTEGIAYQSKDILSKVSAERMTDKSFDVYGINMPKIRMFVIYTADVKPSSTEAVLDAGCLSMSIEESFLSSLDAKEIGTRIEEKITRGESLTQEEMMEFIIFPLSFPAFWYRNRKEHQYVKSRTIF